MIQAALTIAGSDPSGGAGIQADLKTFHQFGVYGEAVITLLTAQNTQRISLVEVMPAHLVREQLIAVLEDIPPGAAKTGALGDAAVIEVIGTEAARFRFPLVVDPVMISKHGAHLMTGRARELMRSCLLPLAALVTPNLHEAAELCQFAVSSVEGMRQAAQQLVRMGAHAALVKGGHLEGDAVDILCADGELTEYRSPRIDTPHTHGTGCTYSAAITAELAKGMPVRDAVASAKRYIDAAIRTNPGMGGGSGPVNHFARAAE